jgi:Pup amidohydrolase
LFYELQRQGSMRTLISEKEIKDAIFSPPETTRAWFRGRAVARFNHAISSIQWDEIAFREGRKARVISLPEPGGDERLEKLNALVNAENEFEDFFRQLAL